MFSAGAQALLQAERYHLSSKPNNKTFNRVYKYYTKQCRILVVRYAFVRDKRAMK